MSDIILSKESFKNSIETILLQEGFKIQESYYIKELKTETPGRMMVINGQPIQEPPTTIITKITIEDFGDGYIESDGGNKREFTEYSFKIEQSGIENGVVVAIYWDDADEIKKYLNI